MIQTTDLIDNIICHHKLFIFELDGHRNWTNFMKTWTYFKLNYNGMFRQPYKMVTLGGNK